MLPLSALRSMNVLWATPCYISAVSMNYVTSFFELTAESLKLGLNSSVHMRAESLVTRARNEIVRYFLMNPQFTHLFWIDSDVSFAPREALRLLLCDHDVCAGIYPLKIMKWPEQGVPAGTTRKDFEELYTTYPLAPVEQGPNKTPTPDNFLEVTEAPTGFMCIKRDVFTKMQAAYPELNYQPDWHSDNEPSQYYWAFFDCLIDPEKRRYLSEDYAFCKRWRAIGGKVYADLESRLGHQGQHLFQGDLPASIQRRRI